MSITETSVSCVYNYFHFCGRILRASNTIALVNGFVYTADEYMCYPIILSIASRFMLQISENTTNRLTSATSTQLLEFSHIGPDSIVWLISNVQKICQRSFELNQKTPRCLVVVFEFNVASITNMADFSTWIAYNASSIWSFHRSLVHNTYVFTYILT